MPTLDSPAPLTTRPSADLAPSPLLRHRALGQARGQGWPLLDDEQQRQASMPLEAELIALLEADPQPAAPDLQASRLRTTLLFALQDLSSSATQGGAVTIYATDSGDLSRHGGPTELGLVLSPAAARQLALSPMTGGLQACAQVVHAWAQGARDGQRQWELQQLRGQTPLASGLIVCASLLSALMSAGELTGVFPAAQALSVTLITLCIFSGAITALSSRAGSAAGRIVATENTLLAQRLSWTLLRAVSLMTTAPLGLMAAQHLMSSGAPILAGALLSINVAVVLGALILSAENLGRIQRLTQSQKSPLV